MSAAAPCRSPGRLWENPKADIPDGRCFQLAALTCLLLFGLVLCFLGNPIG